MLTKKTKSFKKLLIRIPKRGGRNNQGRITTRHQGGGHKQLYRIVDFRQNKHDIPAVVESIEYDPNRTAHIALVLYKDGERRYVLATQDMKVGDEIVAGEKVPLKSGNRTLLKNLPIGTFVYNVELLAGQGGKLARSAGLSIQILANEDGYCHLKLPSKEVRKVSWNCWASIGQLSNQEYYLKDWGKAGKSRWLGIRPTVRGSAMNPRDHPYGGGEGRAQRGTKRPKTKWGKVTGGHKTRDKKKWSKKFIVKRRK